MPRSECWSEPSRRHAFETDGEPRRRALASDGHVESFECDRGMKGLAHAPAHDLAALIDMHTRKVVGWSMRETLHASIALEALDMAIRRQRPAPGLIQHSDRGIQYAADEYRQALAAAKITPSMSRKGNCLDNAPMESFFHTLKVERVHHRVYATRDEARRDLFAYIEGFYNSRRLHSAIGYRSPADMERMAAGPRPPIRGRIKPPFPIRRGARTDDPALRPPLLLPTLPIRAKRAHAHPNPHGLAPPEARLLQETTIQSCEM